MIVRLPRGLEVDIDNVPSDFEEQVQKCFSEYTEMTNPKYMYHDKLAFIDRMTELLHEGKDKYVAVMELMKDTFEYQVNEYGEFPDERDFLSVEFMEVCYREGQKSRELYSHEWLKHQRKHDQDKIMKVLCRAIKAVMDYKCGEDGI